MKDFIAELFFPSRCVACTARVGSGYAVCEHCFVGMHRRDTLLCGTCGSRLPEAKAVCHRSTPYLLGAAGNYDDHALRELVVSLKFRARTAAAEPLGTFVARYLQTLTLPLEEAVVIPVPLSRPRVRERGFNQSALIADRVASLLKLPYNDELLIRERDTAPQTELRTAAERLSNVSGAFATTGTLDGSLVLLVDDVATTGATLAEASHALKIAGARRIIGVVAAKA